MADTGGPSASNISSLCIQLQQLGLIRAFIRNTVARNPCVVLLWHPDDLNRLVSASHVRDALLQEEVHSISGFVASPPSKGTFLFRIQEELKESFKIQNQVYTSFLDLDKKTFWDQEREIKAAVQMQHFDPSMVIIGKTKRRRLEAAKQEKETMN